MSYDAGACCRVWVRTYGVRLPVWMNVADSTNKQWWPCVTKGVFLSLFILPFIFGTRVTRVLRYVEQPSRTRRPNRPNYINTC